MPGWWKLIKWAAVAVILAMVGYAFAKSFARLDEYQLHWEPAWLMASGVIYLAGLLFSAVYWWWLLRSLGQPVSLPSALRAYYIGHLGKYVPGKAMVIVIRTALVQREGVRPGVVALAVAYEGLMMMSAGAVVAIALMGFTLSNAGEYALRVLVLLPAILLTVPSVFNLIVGRVVARFRKADADPLPPFRLKGLLVGLGLGAAGWVVHGVSLWAAAAAISEHPLDLVKLAEYTTYLSIASVVGFYTPAPGGLGAREGVLLLLLTPTLGAGPAGLAALLLRLAWIVAEGVVSALLWPMPCASGRRRNI